jgi:hypothetical protein
VNPQARDIILGRSGKKCASICLSFTWGDSCVVELDPVGALKYGVKSNYPEISNRAALSALSHCSVDDVVKAFGIGHEQYAISWVSPNLYPYAPSHSAYCGDAFALGREVPTTDCFPIGRQGDVSHSRRARWHTSVLIPLTSARERTHIYPPPFVWINSSDLPLFPFLPSCKSLFLFCLST